MATIGVAAFEDTGLGDLDAVFLATASLSHTKTNANNDQWSVVTYLVSRMAHGPKCWAANDLLMVAEGHPAYEQARVNLTYRPTRELIHIAISSAPLPIRALALWYAIG